MNERITVGGVSIKMWMVWKVVRREETHYKQDVEVHGHLSNRELDKVNVETLEKDVRIKLGVHYIPFHGEASCLAEITGEEAEVLWAMFLKGEGIEADDGLMEIVI